MGVERDDGRLYRRLSVSGAAATDHARWASIDAVRALAALMVLAAHANRLGGPVLPGGLTQRAVGSLAGGVWLFFSVSGFLIAGPFLRALLRGRPRPPVHAYAVRRAARILPAYWVAFAAMLVLVSGAQLAHWWQIPVHGLLLHRLVPGESEKLYFVAWTLGVEAIFYALVPLGAWLVWRFVRGSAAIDVDRLALLILGIWSASVVWGLSLAAAHPFGPHKPMPAGFSVLYAVVALGNFCPGMLVFLAGTREASARRRWWLRYRMAMTRPGLVLTAAVVLFLVAQQLPWQTDPVAYVLFHLLFGV